MNAEYVPRWMKQGGAFSQPGKTHPWAFMERFEIPNFDTDDLYLTRYRLIQTPWFGVYLHRIGTPDSRPTLHDHPWNFLSLVLRGGYIERRLNPKTMEVDEAHPVRLVNRVGVEDAHSIMHLFRVPTWTLMLVGPRRRTWGYWEGPLSEDRRWRWTEFDKHRHAREFDRAVARREARCPHSVSSGDA